MASALPASWTVRPRPSGGAGVLGGCSLSLGSTWRQQDPRAGQPPEPRGLGELPGPCRVGSEPALSKQGCLRAVHSAWLFFFVFITSIYHFYRNNRNINQGNSLLKVPGRVTRLRLTTSWGWGQGWRVEGAGRPVTSWGWQGPLPPEAAGHRLWWRGGPCWPVVALQCLRSPAGGPSSGAPKGSANMQWPPHSGSNTSGQGCASLRPWILLMRGPSLRPQLRSSPPSPCAPAHPGLRDQ